MIHKLGVLSVFVLLAGALNISAMQDWDVPIIGIEEAQAAVAQCIDGSTICCNGGSGPADCVFYNNCVDPYRHGWVACGCNGGGSC